jgi:hypothetical protein
MRTFLQSLITIDILDADLKAIECNRRDIRLSLLDRVTDTLMLTRKGEQKQTCRIKCPEPQCGYAASLCQRYSCDVIAVASGWASLKRYNSSTKHHVVRSIFGKLHAQPIQYQAEETYQDAQQQLSHNSVLIGVMSTASAADYFERVRHRFTHARVRDPAVVIKYVISTKGLGLNHTNALKLENKSTGDLVFLINTVENMNGGKSKDWLHYATRHFPHISYIGKADLDSFLHSKNLVSQLSRLPRNQLVYGADCFECCEFMKEKRLQKIAVVQPPKLVTELFFCGMFYLFSHDLARKMVVASGYWDRYQGNEDMLMSTEALYAGADEIVAVSDMFRLFDQHESLTPSQSRFVQPLGYHKDVVVVHQLKLPLQWKAVNQWLDFSEEGQSTCAEVAAMPWQKERTSACTRRSDSIEVQRQQALDRAVGEAFVGGGASALEWA